MHLSGMQGDWPGAIERARTYSPFLALALQRQPELAGLLEAGDAAGALAWARAAGASQSDVPVALRRERLALAAALAVGDLAGAFPLGRVMTELSAFADRALDAAIADAIVRRVPDEPPGGFTAVALAARQGCGIEQQDGVDVGTEVELARAVLAER